MRSVCCSRELNIGRWSGTLSMLSLNYGHSQVKSWDKFQIVRLFHTKCKINSCVQIQLHYQSLLAFSLLPSDNDRHMFRPQFFLSFNMIHVQTDWQLFLTGGGVGQFSKPAWIFFLFTKVHVPYFFLVDHSLSKNFFFKKASQDHVRRKHLFYCFTPSLPLHNVFFRSFILCRSFLGEISQPPHPLKNGSSLITTYLMNSFLGHNKIHCLCISSHLLVLCTCYHQRYCWPNIQAVQQQVEI